MALRNKDFVLEPIKLNSAIAQNWLRRFCVNVYDNRFNGVPVRRNVALDVVSTRGRTNMFFLYLNHTPTKNRLQIEQLGQAHPIQFVYRKLQRSGRNGHPPRDNLGVLPSIR